MSQEILTEYIEKLLLLLSEEGAGLNCMPLVAQAQEELSAEQLALLLEAVPPNLRPLVWEGLDESMQRETFLWLMDGSRKLLIKQLGEQESKQLLVSLSAEDLLELAEELPDRFLSYAFSQLDREEKERYQQASRYGSEELGLWISFDCPRVSRRLRAQSARNVLRKNRIRYLDAIYTVDSEGKLVGEVELSQLYEAPLSVPLSELQQLQPEALLAKSDIDDAVHRVLHTERLALPVVDEQGVLIGRFDVGSAIAHMREAADVQTAHAGGLADEEDLFAPVWRSSKNRAVWLGVNLLTAFLASCFIGLFEATLQQVVALAVLMPVVASMGGISGSQTLTVIVRGLAMGQVTSGNLKALLNIIAAGVAGVYVPALLDRLHFDPALSGAVILTTVTDIVGFVVFLGLGSLWLV